jgi:foldase protein PrsA
LLKTRGKNELEREKIRRQMKILLQKAKSGEEFSELAKSYSEYPGAKENGGLIENFKRGDMLKPLSDIAFTLPLGEVSDIVETELGYHIIIVIKREIDSRSNAEITAEIKKDKKENEIPIFINKLKRDINYQQIKLP